MAVGVGPPVARLRGLARLEDVAVIARLHPVAVRIELAIESRIRAVVGVAGNGGASGGRLGGGRSRGRDGTIFFGGERLFAGVELGLALRQFLLFVGLVLGVEALLHLPFNLGVSFRFGRLFPAGTKENRQRREQWQEQDSFHKIVRPGLAQVIRRKRDRGRVGGSLVLVRRR